MKTRFPLDFGRAYITALVNALVTLDNWTCNFPDWWIGKFSAWNLLM